MTISSSYRLSTLPNASFSITHRGPEFARDKHSSPGPFSVVASTLVRDMDLPFTTFQRQIEQEMAQWPTDTALGVLPEYCWRTTPPQEVFEYIDQLQQKIRPGLTLVLGTLEFTLNGKYTNNAIVINDGNTWCVPKTKVLKRELAQALVAGDHPGVISLPKFNLGVLICADLWEASLVHHLVVDQKADLLAVPSWTATRQGNRKWAKQDFMTLAKTRSLEFSVPVVVSDHVKNRPTTDVANAVIIADPSRRQQPLPLTDPIERAIARIDLREVASARQRWEDKGLAPAGWVQIKKVA